MSADDWKQVQSGGPFKPLTIGCDQCGKQVPILVQTTMVQIRHCGRTAEFRFDPRSVTRAGAISQAVQTWRGEV